MASEVDICNMALANLGDAATLASIHPPEGSAQAEHCAIFYPVARDALLEMHEWGFATRRATLALLADNPSTTWQFCYARPAGMLKGISVLAGDAFDDTALENSAGGAYTTQTFQLETLGDGTGVVLTNQEDAVFRYVARVTDTAAFSPLFVRALAASLSALLAGPIIKGDAGISVAMKWTMIAFGRDGKSGLFGQAAASDANQRRNTTRDRHQVAWLNAR